MQPKEPQSQTVNLDSFPKPPSPFDQDGNPAYFLATSGVFDKVINRDGDTEVVMTDEAIMVVYEWYWNYIEDYITDVQYAVKNLKLLNSEDPP